MITVGYSTREHNPKFIEYLKKSSGFKKIEVIEKMKAQRQEEVLEKIRPICEYNYSHLMRTDWYGEYFMPAFVAYFLQT